MNAGRGHVSCVAHIKPVCLQCKHAVCACRIYAECASVKSSEGSTDLGVEQLLAPSCAAPVTSLLISDLFADHV